MKVKRPTLFVDKEKVSRNINRIVQKAEPTGTVLVPHFKTHQSHEIGRWFSDCGIENATVSSVAMAKYFADGGWNKIYIAFPLNINEIEDIADLAAQVNLTVLVNEQVQLEALIDKVKSPVHVKVEIETGSKRSGILANEYEKINLLLEVITSSQHEFDGFYSHFGHTYKAQGSASVKEIFDRSFDILNDLKAKYHHYDPSVSLGDTPSASVLTSYEGIKSMHAGNYVFYDLTQEQIGSCIEDDIAISLAVPIVSKNPQSLELIVYGGGIHLSKETLASVALDTTIFGKVVEFTASGWTSSLEGCYLKSISQEHGVVQVTQKEFNRLNIGDTLGILPVHSCMTADCMRSYSTVDGDKIDHFQGTEL